MRLARLAGIEVDSKLRDCFSSLDVSAPADYRELASLLAQEWLKSSPSRVGISGGQGAGKTTLGGLIEAACSERGIRACIISLDDFYLPKASRRERAEAIHPLFETRGPPGTHDMALCAATLSALEEARDVSIPVFDKTADDRSGSRIVRGPFDVTVLEGWCVGARAIDGGLLDDSPNTLEIERDPDGSWRRAVNQTLLNDYEPIWNTLDSLIYLRVPSIDAVARWRAQQEEAYTVDRRMTRSEIDTFVEYFERITRRMLVEQTALADWVVGLDEEHRVEDLLIRTR